jgi:signal transduction histidine kinase
VRRSLRTWLLGSHVLALLLPVLFVVGTGILGHELREQTRADLENQAALLELLVVSALQDHEGADLSDLAELLTPRLIRARERTLAGIRVVDHTGVVVASSGDELGDDLSDRVEVHKALEGAVALSQRPRESPTKNPLMSRSRRASVRMYLASPIRFRGQTVGALALSRTPREEVQAMYQALPWWVIAAPVSITVALALLAAKLFSRSLRSLAETAHRIADGDFSATERLDRPRASRVREVGELASAFASMTERLQARLGYISEFAGNVSHEFKTPIATLRGTVELIRDDTDMPAAQRERFLDNALAELVRLEHLVSGLLTLARAEESAGRTHFELDGLVSGVAQRYDVPVEGQAGTVHASAEQLDVAIDNLVENALRYGGDDVRVRLRLTRDGDQVAVCVHDDGPGIAPANLPRIFDRFFTTARGSGGTGLGLALVRTIANAHGGRVQVESRPGDTRFTLSLPRVA